MQRNWLARWMLTIAVCLGLAGVLAAGASAVVPDGEAAGGSEQLPGRRPNLLLIVLDDLGYADIGAYGCRDFATPALDGIAQRGVRFTRFRVSSPVCSPCRSGLLTGRYQNRFGHEFNHPEADRAGFGLPAGTRTFAQVLRDAGYATGHIGKWHVGNPLEAGTTPADRGFQESVWFPGQRKLPPLRFVVNGVSGESNEPFVDQAIAGEACDFIRRHRSREWCLYLAFLTPHVPLDLPPGSEEPFAALTNPRRRACAASMRLADEAIGKILETLRETGVDEQTLVLLISDNGAYPANGSSNAPWRGTKGTLWEGGIRVPALAQWPGVIPAGSVCDAPVISLDVFPTLLGAAGCALPEDPPIDGVDIRPWLDGSIPPDLERPLFWRYGEQFAVTRGNWKLVHAALPGPPGRFAGGLFDLEADPAESRDLSRTQPAIRTDLQGLWDAWNRLNVPPAWSPEPGEVPDHP